MNVFVDTAAFLAVLNGNDRYHATARQTWDEILSSGANLFTSNYVLVETYALLQHRFGMDALRMFEGDVLPAMAILWVDEDLHRQGVSAMLAANRRNLSLVDCTSFEAVRRFGLDAAFTFDEHFREQGFKVIPE